MPSNRGLTHNRSISPPDPQVISGLYDHPSGPYRHRDGRRGERQKVGGQAALRSDSWFVVAA